MSLWTCRSQVSCRPRSTSISSPETHVGSSELPGRRFRGERGIKGRWWKWTSRAEEEPGERQEQVVEMGKYPDHLDSPPALSSFSLQDLNSLRTMTPLKILSPKIYASRDYQWFLLIEKNMWKIPLEVLWSDWGIFALMTDSNMIFCFLHLIFLWLWIL